MVDHCENFMLIKRYHWVDGVAIDRDDCIIAVFGSFNCIGLFLRSSKCSEARRPT